jgi:hypothetical protein
MTLIDLISQNRLSEAKEIIFNRLDEISAEHLEEEKIYVALNTYTEVKVDEQLDEANVVRVGKIQKIRRRIRRNNNNQIVVQRNKRRSTVKGFRISGNSVVRIPAIQRIQKSRKLKRYWKTKGKSKLRRTLLKRKMSLRRRTSMGIK